MNPKFTYRVLKDHLGFYTLEIYGDGKLKIIIQLTDGDLKNLCLDILNLLYDKNTLK